jgi:hypothetical protein
LATFLVNFAENFRRFYHADHCKKTVKKGFDMTTEYLVWYEEDGEEPEDGHLFSAVDEEMAAQAWAKRYDEHGDHTLLNGNEATVAVRESNNPDATIHYFVVSGEVVPHYWANPSNKG